MRVLEYGFCAEVGCPQCRSKLEVDYRDIRAVPVPVDACGGPRWAFRATCCVCGAPVPVRVNHTYIEGTLIQEALERVRATPVGLAGTALTPA